MRERRSITVTGIVQGVGFRPFVHELAVRIGLCGQVKNQNGVVLINVEGETSRLDAFLDSLTTRPPPLAQIDRVHWVSAQPRGDTLFQIEASAFDSQGPVFIAPDLATCDDCLRELFDPTDRRFLYPFLNCANCGPRLSIIHGVPYDRARTAMSSFAMCPACRSEYNDPRDRRYHAQPIACPACGPKLHALDRLGQVIDAVQPLALAVDALKAGQIVALKSLGGYHLACNAIDSRAVAELRSRKQRDEKPLAVMVRDLAAALVFCEINAAERALLLSRGRPITLLRRRPGTNLAEAIASGNPYVGVMLPYTPLHHLLLDALNGLPLVMTSGNLSDEPIAFKDADALARLAAIADLFLTNDRPIQTRCDDSVTRVVAGAELPIRRSRGSAPRPIELPIPCPQPTLALGGQLKATFALGRDRHAFLSHHLGDLDHYEGYLAYVASIGHYQRLFGIEPKLIVHDLHPDYASTRFASTLDQSLPRLAVQHHEAHVASCMADNHLDRPVIGLAFDGNGLGTDGALWGSEFFTGDFRDFQRAAHLRYVPLPGGDQAVREPWRMAASYLIDAGLSGEFLCDRVPSSAFKTIARMIERRLNSPETSSMGRLFDAVAALAGLRDRVTYEGQAAVELEWLATREQSADAYPFAIEDDPTAKAPLIIDTRPLIGEIARDLRRGLAPAIIGRRFHFCVVEVVSQVCGQLRRRTGISEVVLSGGVFLNALLTVEVVDRLNADGFQVYRHQQVPPNDGGLSLGQLAIASARAGTF